MSELEAVSPIDGRYKKQSEPLAPYFSEAALIKYRFIVEGEYLIALSELGSTAVRVFTDEEKKLIRDMYQGSVEDAKAVKTIEATTNHDVKAVEYAMKDKLKTTSLADCIEWIHFALTSEDTNNLSYALMLAESLRDVIIPEQKKIFEALKMMAREHKGLPMLARTHGQPASPTTFGKEFNVFASRLERQIQQLEGYKILAKLNGASGNYNAHMAAYPQIDWIAFTKNFITNLGVFRSVQLEVNLVTTQIEPHDTYAELFDVMKRFNTILISLNQDIWRYISDGWITQKPKEGEVGSSTMPHKVNPINFENSEGNLGIANALLSFFSSKLPIARLQRDLTDSTIERNFGTAFAYSLIAYKSFLRGLGKISVNRDKIKEDLLSHPEIVAEAIQTVFRAEGLPVPYEQLKELTRGKTVSLGDFQKFIDQSNVKEEVKQILKKMTPDSYIGLASILGEK